MSVYNLSRSLQSRVSTTHWSYSRLTFSFFNKMIFHLISFPRIWKPNIPLSSLHSIFGTPHTNSRSYLVLFSWYCSPFLSPRPSRNSGPGSHSRLVSSITSVRDSHFYSEKTPALSSLVDPRPIVPIQARRALSSWSHLLVYKLYQNLSTVELDFPDRDYKIADFEGKL